VGTTVLDVPKPAYTGGAYGVDPHESSLHLRTLLQKGVFNRVQRVLRRNPSRRITVLDYISKCQEEGVPEAEALQLLRALHTVGVLLHFDDHPLLRNHVFLHPDDVMDAVFASYNLPGPTQSYLNGLREAKQGELDAVTKLLQEKQFIRKGIVQAAEKWASAFNATFGVALTSGVAFYAYLVFVELSWDIMEPLTYFTGSIISIVGYWYWLLTAGEFEYSNMTKGIADWRTRVKHRELALLGADGASAPAKVEKDFIDVDGALHPVKLPKNPEELSFLADLHGLEARVSQLQAELRQLNDTPPLY